MKELLSAGSYPYSARPRSNLGSVRTHTKAQRFEAPCDSRPTVVELAKAPPTWNPPSNESKGATTITAMINTGIALDRRS